MPGLLDGLMFDQSAYGGQSGGLLDLLKQYQQMAATPQPDPNAGFPGQSQNARVSDAFAAMQPQQQPAPMNLTPDRFVPVGNYQMPQFGNPPPVDPAQIPPNAQPMQGQMAQPGVGDRIGAALGGFSNGIQNGGLVSAIRGGIEGAQTGAAPENQTQKFLVSKGIDPALAQQITRDPGLMRAVLPHLIAPQGQTDDIKEYQFAKQQGFTGSFEQWTQRKRAGAGEYGLNPVWGRDKDGNPVMLQAGKSGEAIQTKLPDGVTLSGKEPIKMDAGTHFVLMDPLTRQVIGQVPKNVAGVESEKVQGEAQGQAKVALPNALAQAEQSLGVIDKALGHPGLDRSTGVMGKLPSMPGGNAYDFDRVVDQIKGKAFLQAFESLKGAGAITEAEGIKATNAIARLDQAQSKEAFVESLNELKGIIRAGMDRAKAKAGQPGSSPPAAAPATDLKKKYGLD